MSNQQKEGDIAKATVRVVTRLAYKYSYPLVLMDSTKIIQTNVPQPDNETGSAPINQFFRATAFPDATFTDVVSPNADTLYTNAWLGGISNDPIVLHIPEVPKYFLFPILDAWSNVVVSPGTRTADQYPPGDYAIVGPGWTGELPPNVGRISIPTGFAWILGRIQTNGPEDYETVHQIQAQFSLTPLSSWNSTPPYVPPTYPNLPVPIKDTNPVSRVKNLSAAEFFKLFSVLWKTNPPLKDDASILEILKLINLVPGNTWDISSLPSWAPEVMQEAIEDVYANLNAEGQALTTNQNGWLLPPSYAGNYGDHYTYRAYCALTVLGLNIKDDAIYPTSEVDSDGNTFDARYSYKLTFPSAPPVSGFWSLTMYNQSNYFVANSANKYNVSSAHNPVVNGESIDIYIQSNPPADANLYNNWLPSAVAPADGPAVQFHLFLRFYWPALSLIDETWVIPYVVKQTNSV